MYLWPSVRTVALDLENTGINRKRDKIIQYGIYGIDANHDILDCGELVDAEVSTGREPLNIPGVTEEAVHNAVPLREGHLTNIYRYCHNSLVVMHHYQFDWAFILAEFKRNNRDPPIPKRIYCTLEVCRSILRLNGSKTLQNLCNNLNIPLELAHNALHDAKATFQLFITLVNTYNNYLPDDFYYVGDPRQSLWSVCSSYFAPHPSCKWVCERDDTTATTSNITPTPSDATCLDLCLDLYKYDNKTNLS